MFTRISSYKLDSLDKNDSTWQCLCLRCCIELHAELVLHVRKLRFWNFLLKLMSHAFGGHVAISLNMCHHLCVRMRQQTKKGVIQSIPPCLNVSHGYLCMSGECIDMKLKNVDEAPIG